MINPENDRVNSVGQLMRDYISWSLVARVCERKVQTQFYRSNTTEVESSDVDYLFSAKPRKNVYLLFINRNIGNSNFSRELLGFLITPRITSLKCFRAYIENRLDSIHRLSCIFIFYFFLFSFFLSFFFPWLCSKRILLDNVNIKEIFFSSHI